ncbi:E3 ubiquitin-protein ligase SPL2-like [Pyrus communis]|uniref:E3 ubiquitin-protein ligase SPL2-like n=1 Tax=Pyrus communis TaxID=23211 RepID=UPI0035C062FA
MPRGQILNSLVSGLALSFKSHLVGFALAYAAVLTLHKFSSYSSALRKVRKAPSVKVSGLRSNPALDQSDQSDAKLIVVRGIVEAKSAFDRKWNSFKSGVLVQNNLHFQRTQPCVVSDWMALFGWRSDDSIILVDRGFGLKSILDFVYRHNHHVDASLYSALKTLIGDKYPVGVLDDVKILPLGKEISAVGLYSFKNGVPVIRPCKDLPYFLSEMSKDQMVVDLILRTKILFWSGIVLGSISIGVLGHSVARNWNRWRVLVYEYLFQQQRQRQQSIPANESNVETQAEVGVDAAVDVPQQQLCVVCYTSRRQYAFIPCGHLICCELCSVNVRNLVSPKCPLCREEFFLSVRIYDP